MMKNKGGAFSDNFGNDFNNNQKSKEMTKEQALAMIAEKIAGQGNQVDCGGALSQILNALVNGAIAVEVSDITAIDGAILDSLNVGDKIAKVTGKQKHLYQVSYKGEGVGEGICLTYVDASVIETVSYDFTSEGWAYNSTDKWEKA